MINNPITIIETCKFMRRFLSLFLLMTVSLTIFSETVERDGLFFNLNYQSKLATFTSGNTKYKGDIVIPESININGEVFRVSSIEDAAFYSCNELTSVFIPASISNIGKGIINGCDALESISVSPGNMVYDSRNNCNAIIETASNALVCGCNNSVIPTSIQTIRPQAFKGCMNLRKVVIPNSVTSIGFSAFQDCINLSDVSISNNVTDIAFDAFRGCKNLVSIKLPQYLSYIGEGAFAGSGLHSVIIPQGLTAIEQDAFYQCQSLKSVYIPRSVKTIADFAFSSLVLSDIYCYTEGILRVADNAFPFAGGDNGKTLHVPANYVDLYKNDNFWSRKFQYIVALTDEELQLYSITPQIPTSLQESNGVQGIYTVNPESYRSNGGDISTYYVSTDIFISENADGSYTVSDMLGGYYSEGRGYGHRYKMKGQISVSDEGGVSLIDSYIPGWEDSLTRLSGTYDSSSSTFTIEAEYVDGLIFYQTWTKDNSTFKIDGVNYSIDARNNANVRIGNYSGDIVIPEEVWLDNIAYPVTSIDGAFGGCAGLTSVKVPNSVTSMKKAFVECSGLITANIPDGITSIEQDVFQNCASLKSLHIPHTVTSIGDFAFSGCSSLEVFDFSDGLVTIGNCAFSRCSALKNIFIPKNVISIGYGVFDDCSAIESTVVDSKNEKYDSREDCNGIVETYSNKLIYGCKNTVVPSDVVTIGADAFRGCKDLVSFIVPNNVSNIEGATFSACSGLREIVIGNGIKKIGGAFELCTSLENFYLYSETVPETSEYAFYEAPIQNATLHVPAVSLNQYRQTEPWRGFGNIVALAAGDPQSTDVRSILVKEEEKKQTWYDLSGRKLSTEPTAKGLYIINGKKVLK